MNWHVLTSSKEQQALPCAMYLVLACNSELDAIDKLYQSDIKPIQYLGIHQIPDYTCAVQI
jgi:ADP-dependent phosphofructokinase/glucokinase